MIDDELGMAADTPGAEAIGEERARLATRAGDVLQRGKDYVAAIDPAEVRADVEDTIRARPILSICVAAFIGFVAGRMMRD